jgi:hypothetical protein
MSMSRLDATLAVFALAAWGSAAAVACCPPAIDRPTPQLAVREAVSRSATFALPLDEASRQSLLMFLAAGGNNDGIEEGALITVVYPDAEKRWSQLLEALSTPGNVEVADMSNGTYASWFKSPPLRHVVDARDARPNLACPPFAFVQERFVWVFRCKDAKTMGELFVQQDLAPRAE